MNSSAKQEDAQEVPGTPGSAHPAAWDAGVMLECWPSNITKTRAIVNSYF